MKFYNKFDLHRCVCFGDIASLVLDLIAAVSCVFGDLASFVLNLIAIGACVLEVYPCLL